MNLPIRQASACDLNRMVIKDMSAFTFTRSEFLGFPGDPASVYPIPARPPHGKQPVRTRRDPHGQQRCRRPHGSRGYGSYSNRSVFHSPAASG